MIILVPQSGPNSINKKYGKWLYSLGLTPLMLPYTEEKQYIESIERACSLVDGILLPGGIDVHPELYNEEIYGALKCDMEFDLWQMAIITTAIKLKKPIYGICRGLQLLYVYFNGILVQEFDKEYIEHDQTRNLIKRTQSFHKVTIKGFKKEYFVNSMHHQGIDSTEDFLKCFNITVKSVSDNAVEGIEHKIHKISAVQFHPEELNRPEWNNHILEFFKGV